MTRFHYRTFYFGLLFFSFINSSVSYYSPRSKSTIANTIVNTLDEISNQNNKLKTLIRSFFEYNQPPKIPEPEEDDCMCTPFYLCNNGKVNKDGSKFLEPRLRHSSVNPCKTIGDICCEPYSVNHSVTKNVSEVMPSDVECGYGTQIAPNYSNYDVTTANFGEFPWTALVLNIKYQYQCVGSLIHPEVILTSAHCLNISEQYIARVGEWNTSSKTESYPHQNMRVKSLIKHPGYNSDNLIYNAALLFLEKPFNLDVNVNTACLAEQTINFFPKFQKPKCFATGWGKDTPTGVYRRVMKKIEFSVIPNSLCQTEFRRTRLGKRYELDQSFLCGVGKDGTDLCTGDGGGPLVCQISGQPLRYQQVGITSWGIECGKNIPSVFTRVSAIKTWINEVLRAHNLNSKYYSFT